MKKDKIINDPIYGFINIESQLITKIINHPYFQRLREIKQLGLSYLVYPGAKHTRFQHAIGSMYLMQIAINQLRKKNNIITDEESEALKIAILLHDIGHSPFSHALENSLVKNISHESLSSLFMYKLNEVFNNKLSLAIKIFNNNYHKKFLHQLVSSQIDMDRLDYLKRDSFFSGVKEGNINTDRIIKMINVVNDKLVVEEKGIYSIENFLIARRLMYWQVYLHKTVISSENMLIKVLNRAKEIINKKIFTTPALNIFLENDFSHNDFINNSNLIDIFSKLDDTDIYVCLKYWMKNEDFVLSNLSKMIVNRNLLKIEIQNIPFSDKKINSFKEKFIKKYNINRDEINYFVFTDKVSNRLYNLDENNINILLKSGKIIDISKASDQFNNDVLNRKVEKYFLCYPKSL
ncbi:MAG: phosphohydrolase [Flavobacteriales bacterium]|nr:phosphohydrolase [Flavobacteriales bacterium]